METSITLISNFANYAPFKPQFNMQSTMSTSELYDYTDDVDAGRKRTFWQLNYMGYIEEGYGERCNVNEIMKRVIGVSSRI